jgi:hypothetical protein
MREEHDRYYAEPVLAQSALDDQTRTADVPMPGRYRGGIMPAGTNLRQSRDPARRDSPGRRTCPYCGIANSPAARLCRGCHRSLRRGRADHYTIHQNVAVGLSLVLAPMLCIAAFWLQSTYVYASFTGEHAWNDLFTTVVVSLLAAVIGAPLAGLGAFRLLERVDG